MSAAAAAAAAEEEVGVDVGRCLWQWVQMILAGIDAAPAMCILSMRPKDDGACSRLPTRSQWLLLCTGKVYNVACSIYGSLFLCCIPCHCSCAAVMLDYP